MICVHLCFACLFDTTVYIAFLFGKRTYFAVRCRCNQEMTFCSSLLRFCSCAAGSCKEDMPTCQGCGPPEQIPNLVKLEQSKYGLKADQGLSGQKAIGQNSEPTWGSHAASETLSGTLLVGLKGKPRFVGVP